MLLDPHLGTIIWTLVTFSVVFLILAKFAWPNLIGALDEREERIRKALEGAGDAQAQAEAALEEHRDTLATASTEARQIVTESREAAERVHQETIEQAREEAQRLVEQARITIEREKTAAMAQLRREMGDLAIQAASALVDENLDNDRNRKLVDDFINSVPESIKQ